jgi:hypothetical protein
MISTETLFDVSRLNEVVNTFIDDSFVDNIQTRDLVRLGQSLQGMNAGRITFVTVPTTGLADEEGNEQPRTEDIQALFDAIMAGASGYVLKEIRGNDLIEAIRQVAAGKSLLDPMATQRVLERLRNGEKHDSRLDALSDQEKRILDLIGEGMTNRQIHGWFGVPASALMCSPPVPARPPSFAHSANCIPTASSKQRTENWPLLSEKSAIMKRLPLRDSRHRTPSISADMVAALRTPSGIGPLSSQIA